MGVRRIAAVVVVSSMAVTGLPVGAWALDASPLPELPAGDPTAPVAEALNASQGGQATLTASAAPLSLDGDAIAIARGRALAALADGGTPSSMRGALEAMLRKLDASTDLLARIQRDSDTLVGRGALASAALAWSANIAGLPNDPIAVPEASSSPSAALERLWQRQGVSLSSEDRSNVERLDRLPAETRLAVTEVIDAYGAFEQAAEAEKEIVTADPRWPALHEWLVRTGDSSDPSASAGEAPDFPLTPDEGAARGHVLMARAALTQASTALAAAVAVEQSEIAASSSASSHSCVAGEAGWWICFSENPTTNDTYTWNERAALLIDLGGDDRYENNAGGAHGWGCRADYLWETAVAVDVSGNDLYQRRSTDPWPYPDGMAGGGDCWGHGYLFDGTGDDTYSYPIDRMGPASNGSATRFGSGALIDLEGSDHFVGGNGAAAWAYAAVGEGYLFDGAGNDFYDGGNGGSTGGLLCCGSISAGFLMDGSGADRYQGTARDVATNGGVLGFGSGLLLDGSGGDRYEGSEATNGGTVGPGSAFLLDGAGRDVYLSDSDGSNGGVSARRLDPKAAGAAALLDLSGHDAYAGGAGGSNGWAPVSSFGLLLDGQGNDDYRDGDGGSGTNLSVVPKGAGGAQIDANLQPLLAGSFSDDVGLEDFYGYEPFEIGGNGRALLNVANGNLVVHHTDLEVPGQGLNLRLTRTYNSARDYVEGPLGKGWSIGISDGEGLLDGLLAAVFSLDITRVVETFGHEDEFDFYDADGTRHHFVKGGAEGPTLWHSPPGVNLTLSERDEGGTRVMTFTRPDGVLYEFRPFGLANTDYRLRRIADRSGNELSFAYSGNLPSRITDPTGRTLDLSYDGLGHLASTTFTAGTESLTSTYNVDNTGRLVSVTEAAGTGSQRTTSYAYGDTGLSAVTDPRGNPTTFGYDGPGRLDRVVDRAGKAWAIGHGEADCPAISSATDHSGSLTCIENPEGAFTTWSASALGNPIARMDAGDDAGNGLRRNVRRWAWGANRLLEATDEAGTSTQYAYNDYGQIVQTRVAAAGEPAYVTVMAYVDRGNGVADLDTVTAGVGTADPRLWDFDHDVSGKLVRVKDPTGGETTLSYGAGGRLASMTDARGKTTTYSNYHSSGQPGLITDPIGRSVATTFDFRGLPTQTTDREGHVWSKTYDRLGRLLTETDPLGARTSHCYDANGNETLEVRPTGTSLTPCTSYDGTDGHSSKRTYDPRDLPSTTLTKSAGAYRKEKYVYADDGSLVELYEPRSFSATDTSFVPGPTPQKVTYGLFPNNRLSSMTDEEGGVTDYSYTPTGWIRVITEPSNGTARRTTTYAYNGRGQVSSELVSGVGAPTTYAYSPHGERIQTTDPKGNTTTTTYDGMGRPAKVVDALGKVTTRSYDGAGNLVKLERPTGTGDILTTLYQYTARNEIACETDPSDTRHAVTYSYDGEGRQVRREDRWSTSGDGCAGSVERTTSQSYDAAGRLTQTSATGQGLPTTTATFTVDSLGRRTAAATTLGATQVWSMSATYSEAGEVATWTETNAGQSLVSAYSYRPDGTLSGRTVGGQTTSYTHDRAGRETGADPWFAGAFGTSVATNGQPLRETSANGMVTTSAYDAAGRLISAITRGGPNLTDSILAAWQGITYDANSNRTAEQVTLVQVDPAEPPLAGEGSYSYDRLDRLTSATHPLDVSEASSYTYDDAGNVIADADATSEYSANRLVRRRPSADPTHPTDYAYDHFGNQREAAGPGGTQTTDYEAASHTRTMNTPDSTVTYVYDAYERLVRRDETPIAPGSSTTATLFFHDRDSGAIVLETDLLGAVKTRYALDSADEPIAQESLNGADTKLGFYVTDPRRNTVALVDPDRKVVATYGYDPFGNDVASVSKAAAGWNSRLRYQMAPKDPATGAYALGPRMYDPAINRFVGADFYVAAAANLELQLDPTTSNAYLYAGANPVNAIDDGHLCIGIGPIHFMPCGGRRRRPLTPDQEARCRELQAEAERILGSGHNPSKIEEYNS